MTKTRSSSSSSAAAAAAAASSATPISTSTSTSTSISPFVSIRPRINFNSATTATVAQTVADAVKAATSSYSSENQVLKHNPNNKTNNKSNNSTYTSISDTDVVINTKDKNTKEKKDKDKDKDKEKDNKPKNSLKHILSQSYWDSTEAKKLFNTKDDEPDAKVSANRRLSMLKLALSTPNGYQSIIDVKPEHLHLLKENEIEVIKNKIMYLSIVLQLAVDNMNIKKSWSQCCDETIAYMKNHYTLIGGSFGFTPLKSASTLKKIHATFRKNDKIEMAANGDILEKRIQKHLEKKRKLEDKHKVWLEKGWARNRKLKKLEKKLDSMKEEQKKKDSDDDTDDGDNGDDDEMISSADYEMIMLQRY